MNWIASLANTTWALTNVPAWMTFRRAVRRPGATQGRLLLQMLRDNADSDYGRRHRFADIRTYAEFVRRVPPVDYDLLHPWVERIRMGEQDVLATGRVTHLIPTSGSTNARKLIPFTAQLQRQFNRAIDAWVADLVLREPGLLLGPAYWSITPPTSSPRTERSSVPIGFADDASYLSGWKAWLARAVMVGPGDLRDPADQRQFRVGTLLSLVRCSDLRLISVWHPSFLALLLDALPEYWDELLNRLRRDDRRRVAELEKLDPSEPGRIWPALRVVSCWGDGHAALALTALRARLPGVLIQPKGLLATEAVVTIPFAGAHPVAVDSHFFEFLDETGQPFLVEELRGGHAYEVIVTTGGGLWRYRLRDRVEVDGWLEKTPSLRFVGRADGTSDLRGEKLSETFVDRSVRKCLEPAAGGVRFAMLAPDETLEGPGYALYVEGDIPDGLAEALEDALRANPHYACCRDLGQLRKVRVFLIERDGYRSFVDRLIGRGQRLGEIKPVALSRIAGWSRRFRGKYLETVQSGRHARRDLRAPGV